MEKIIEFKEYLKNIKGFSIKTIEIYVKYIEKLYENSLDYKKLLKTIESNSNNTKRIALSGVKCFYKFIKDIRYKEIELPKKISKILPYITNEEYKGMLIQVKKKSKKQYMKYIIIKLLYETGIRASELLSIKKSDIVNNSIIINGKGGSQRFVNVSNILFSELNIYTYQVKSNLLFDFGYKNLYKKIRELSKDKKITPHMFRRGYAKFCYLKGIPIYDISLSMGHNDINTTAFYIKKKSEDVNVAHIFL